jgi:hypothetical protein
MDFNTIISFLTSPEIQERLLPTKIAFLALSAFFLGIIIFVLLRTHYLQWLFIQDFVEFFTVRTYGTKKITKQWQGVLKRLDSGLESEYKLAVIEADRMLDSALKKMGYLGANLEERLAKLTSITLPNIEDVYQAHQARNNILHDPDYKLELAEAKKIINVYDEAFRSLQILS